MKHWGSSGVQENEIVSFSKLIENIIKIPKELIKRQRHCKNSYYADINIKLILKFVKIPFYGAINIFYLSTHKMPIMEQNKQVLSGFW